MKNHWYTNNTHHNNLGHFWIWNHNLVSLKPLKALLSFLPSALSRPIFIKNKVLKSFHGWYCIRNNEQRTHLLKCEFWWGLFTSFVVKDATYAPAKQQQQQQTNNTPAPKPSRFLPIQFSQPVQGMFSFPLLVNYYSSFKTQDRCNPFRKSALTTSLPSWINGSSLIFPYIYIYISITVLITLCWNDCFVVLSPLTVPEGREHVTFIFGLQEANTRPCTKKTTSEYVFNINAHQHLLNMILVHLLCHAATDWAMLPWMEQMPEVLYEK